MKMTLCKLIANDIVNYGMDQTSNFNYIVCLDSYIDDFDEESKNYIYNHLEEICNDISNNENVADLHYDKNKREFDMVFYWGNLMNATEKYVADIIDDLGEKDRFVLEDIREIAEDVILDDSLKNLTKEKIKNHKNMEIDL
jgi:hypothetical protein